MDRLRPRLSYANVVATLALFLALGGTGYAVSQLPANSVGSKQIRRGAVGPSELRSAAVSSRSLHDRTVRLRDLSLGARSALRGAIGPQGAAGPPGPTYHAAFDAAGARVRGNATSSSGWGGDNTLTVGFDRDVSSCDAVATLASVPGGPVPNPPPGRITVGPDGTGVRVATFAADGSPAALPFSLVVAC
jgi:hypothetical protein